MYTQRIVLDSLRGGEDPVIDLLGHVSSLAPRGISRERQAALLTEEYRRRGESCFPDLEGSFAAVIRDRDCVKVVTDRVASRKVYYYQPPGRREVWISERLAGLLAMGVPKVFDRRALYEYCTVWYLLGNRTLFEGVRVARPAHVLRVDSSGLTETPYWQPVVEGYADPDRSRESCVEEFRCHWDAEIERISCLSERFLVPLSGGLDGRLILSSILNHVAPERVLTFTFGVPGTYDFELGQTVAKAFGCRNIAVRAIEENLREQIDANLDEFEGQTKCVPGSPFPFSRFVGTETTTVLSGFIGDVIGGSWTKRPYCGSKVFDPDEMSRILERTHVESDARDAAAVFGLSSEETAAAIVFPPPMHTLYATDNVERHYYENRAPNFVGYVLFEGRDTFDYHLPFISRPLFDFSLRVPARHKIHRRYYFDCMRKHHPRLASIPAKSYWGIPLRSNPLRLAFGIARRKGRNFLNRRALELLNRPLFKDPYLNYIDEFDLFRRDESFRALVGTCLDGLRERPFVEKEQVDRVIRESRTMTSKRMRLVSYLAQIECVAQWYDGLKAGSPLNPSQ